ncbi:hypothetical protein GIB67_029813 [Kingdonia uniflora]|uniref:ENTH domain-containing protein n=1 Tax=Kingdonia uniflora TaxID=39325 RepID=A0A7J7NJ14_9MAGN|nr:hypothetical protein GIB67_029813 [Kingdonia uniflora]
MAPSTIRKALGAVKDRTSISLAKVGNSTTLSDLDVAIVKATRHEEYPAEDRHIKEILSLTCYSKTYISSCVNSLSKRLSKTKNWTVALKTLILIHRLLLEGDPAYEQEIFFATRRGTRMLNMSDFRDMSQSGSWDFSAFVRTFSRYLDEQLEFRMHGRRSKRIGRSRGGVDDDDEDPGTVVSLRTTPASTKPTLSNSPLVLAWFNHIRVAKSNRVVIVALYPIVKESFHIYYDITEIMGILIDRFMELEIPDCVKVHDIFTRIGKQFDELDTFYSWCKTVGIARSSEYPEIEKIAPKKLDVMEEFIRDKSALAQSKKLKNLELRNHVVPHEVVREEVIEQDMNEIKALPPPEGFIVEEEKEEIKEEEKEKEVKNIDTQNANFFDLREDSTRGEEQGDKLALALFDGGATTTTTTNWEAFTMLDDSADWETALVQSTSKLNNQKTELGGGFDMFLLNGMYQQPGPNTGVSGPTGSSSSVAIGSAGKPAMLALPAPSVPSTGAAPAVAGADPFVASLQVAPPAYVQMSEMEKKQKLLVEEQLMWQQYTRDGMQGHLGVQQNPYGMGGYTKSY